jgi:PKD repeat protein
LKGKKENMNVRELFRSKLEYSEVIPGDSVRNELMRKLAVKEFMRFDPSHFNIYYIGGIAAAAIAAIIIITSGPGSSKNQNDNILPVPSAISDNITSVEPPKLITGDKPVKNKPALLNIGERKSSRKSELNIGAGAVVSNTVDIRKDSTSVSIDTLKKTATFIENLTGRKSHIDLQRTIGASFDVSASGGCSPLKIRFLNKSTSYDSCRWEFGDGGFSSEKNPEWIFDLEGEYKIVLKVFDSNGTQATASTSITVHPRPVARFEIAPEKPVIPDDEIRFINYSVDAVRYRWEFGDGNTSNSFEPDHKYRKYNSYNVRLIAWSEFGCSDSMLVKNAFSISGCFIDFPNAFIPGSDGPSGGYYSTKSDEAARIFHPVTSGVNEYHLKIFSKLGILIFESNDINIGWDGYLKGQLCEGGVYIWKVRGTYKNGEPFVKMGDVTLLKN